MGEIFKFEFKKDDDVKFSVKISAGEDPDIDEMTMEELTTKLGELKAELFNLRFRHATNQLENPMLIVNCKKDIARVKTVIRERELKNA